MLKLHRVRESTIKSVVLEVGNFQNKTKNEKKKVKKKKQKFQNAFSHHII